MCNRDSRRLSRYFIVEISIMSKYLNENALKNTVINSRYLYDSLLFERNYNPNYKEEERKRINELIFNNKKEFYY